MTAKTDGVGSQVYWFVGASWGDGGDQTNRFIQEGIWENGYVDRYLDLIRSIQPGDRIAIKSSYTRKNNLPFENRGQTVSVMAIKAIGKVLENPGDGQVLKVAWTIVTPVREWYFFTYRNTISKTLPGDWTTDSLISFTFDNQKQNIDQFRNSPSWRGRFGDPSRDSIAFKWTKFYEKIADAL
jgi:5-methylcytosine-specific restriction protein B